MSDLSESGLAAGTISRTLGVIGKHGSSTAF